MWLRHASFVLAQVDVKVGKFMVGAVRNQVILDIRILRPLWLCSCIQLLQDHRGVLDDCSSNRWVTPTTNSHKSSSRARPAALVQYL